MIPRGYRRPDEWTDAQRLEAILAEARVALEQNSYDDAIFEMEHARFALAKPYPEPPTAQIPLPGRSERARISNCLRRAELMLKEEDIAGALQVLEGARR